MPVPSSLTLQPEEDKVTEKTNSSDTCSPSPPESPPACEDSQHNKLFVGALNLETTEETLCTFFAEFGDILECTIMKDQAKRSRGFGFITFKDAETVQYILDAHAENPLVIDEKLIDPKLAVPKRNGSRPTPVSQVRRIFVGGLSSDTDEDDMKEFFSKFGNIEEVQLMYDKHTNRHRGFGFVTFEKPGPAAKVCSIQFHDLKNKKVEVKVAQTKEALAQQADKARAAALSHSYASAAAAFNYSPTYPPFYPHYPIDIFSTPMMLGGNKPRGKMSPMSFSPPAYYGGYSYHGDHHMPSPPFYPSGFPGPYFVRGIPDPSSLGSPDYLSEHFQGLAIMSNPYMSPTGSPPQGFPMPTSYSSNSGDGMGSVYSPPSGLSPKGSPNSTPVNGYTQVSSYQSTQNSSYQLQQPST